MTNTKLIATFYESLKVKDAERMVRCYHENIQFEDPAFGKLQGVDARNMWRMLCAMKNSDLKISYSEIQANEKTGSAKWVAKYNFGSKGRKVTNEVSAQFEFKDGKIIKHTDHFDLWRWARQALGWKGYLLGWSSFMRHTIQQQSKAQLKMFVAQRV